MTEYKVTGCVPLTTAPASVH